MTNDEWREAFVLELRLRDVPGPQIGEALAEVDAHCADSRQSPADAFGDPVAYAATRVAGASGGSFWRTALRAWWIGTAAMAGALAVLAAVGSGRRVGAITLGDVLMVALLPPLFAGVIAFAFRPGMGRRLPVLVAVAIPVCIGAAIASRLALSQPLLRLAAPGLLAAGVLALAAAAVPMLAGWLGPDRVVDPRPRT